MTIDKEKIQRFIQIVHSLNLKLIIDCGPYIDNSIPYGGLPSWMIRKEMKFHLGDKKYISAVKSFIDQLSKVLWKFQYSKGGPIIGILIEKENKDKAYLRNIIYHLRGDGIHEMIFSTKPVFGAYTSLHLKYSDNYVQAKETFKSWRNNNKNLATFISHLPLSERTLYGTKSKQSKIIYLRNFLKYLLKNDASINLSPFSSGILTTKMTCDNSIPTCSNKTIVASMYQETLPINENGEQSLLFFVTRDLLKEMSLFKEMNLKYYNKPLMPPVGVVKLEKQVNVQNVLQKNSKLFTFVKQEKPLIPLYGEPYITYTTFTGRATFINIKGRFNPGRIQILIDDHKLADVISVNSTIKISRKILIPVYTLKKSKEHTLMLLVRTAATVKVENLVVLIQGKTPKWWRYMNLSKLNKLNLNSAKSTSIYRPALLIGYFKIKLNVKLSNCWLKLDGLGEGQVWINNKSIGSYMNINWPFSAILIPSSYLNKGNNNITILELVNSRTLSINLTN